MKSVYITIGVLGLKEIMIQQLIKRGYDSRQGVALELIKEAHRQQVAALQADYPQRLGSGANQ